MDSRQDRATRARGLDHRIADLRVRNLDDGGSPSAGLDVAERGASARRRMAGAKANKGRVVAVGRHGPRNRARAPLARKWEGIMRSISFVALGYIALFGCDGAVSASALMDSYQSEKSTFVGA